MSRENQGRFFQVVSTLIGLLCVGYVGLDLYQAGGIATWGKWRVIAYSVLLFAALWFCHPHSGRWITERVLDRFSGGDGE